MSMKQQTQLFVMGFSLNWFLLVPLLRCSRFVCAFVCVLGYIWVWVLTYFQELGGRRGYKPGLSSEDDFYPCRGSLNAKRWMQGDPIWTHIQKHAIITYSPMNTHTRRNTYPQEKGHTGRKNLEETRNHHTHTHIQVCRDPQIGII